MPGIKINNRGFCSFCANNNNLNVEYPVGERGRKILDKIFQEIKNEGRKNKYDCIIGISGGVDSSYLLYYAKEMGLNPLAVNFNNGWKSSIADNNIIKLTKALGVELISKNLDEREIMSYYRAFIDASLIDICAPCVLGTTTFIFETALKYNIKTILSGYCFRTEGICPINTQYWDGLYFEDVINKFSKKKGSEIKRFGRIDFAHQFMGFHMMSLLTKLKGIRTYKPLNYINYDPSLAAKILQEKFSFKYKKYSHFDCRFKPLADFIHKNKFNYDLGKIMVSGKIRSGLISKKEALENLNSPNFNYDMDYALDKLGINKSELSKVIEKKPANRGDFKNLLWLIKILKPYAFLLNKSNKFPTDSYLELFG
ncbi:MAG: hypothetical protein ACQESP_10560 [Candidatus Muiribacteriota bacterium]